jgi:hypothetical protein
MRVYVLMALALTLMSACAAHPSTPSPTAVHAAWIAALRANNRTAAQQLVVPEAAPIIDRALAQAQYLVVLDTPQTGRLQRVDLHDATAQGAGFTAVSVWRLDRLTSCFRTTLVEHSSRWRVAEWTEFQTDCPPATKGGNE